MSTFGTRLRILVLASLVACTLLAAPAVAHALERAEILARAKVWVSARTPYSQTRYARLSGNRVPESVPATLAATMGYRTDCSGFVSMAMDLRTTKGAPRSLDTGSLPMRLVKTTKAQLQPGDVILRPKTLKIDGRTVPYGHAVIFGGWADASKRYYWGLHQSSSAKRAVRAKIAWGRSGFGSAVGFAPYRVPRVDDRPRIEPKF